MFQSSSKVPDDDVLCPFCVSDKIRELKRVGDLRHHVKTKHPAEMKIAPRGLFSAKTCFFFSINPLEYVKLHDVDNETSAEAQYARYLMAKWSTRRTPGIEERTSKWEEALSKPPQRPIQRKATDSPFSHCNHSGVHQGICRICFWGISSSSLQKYLHGSPRFG
ncbi:hypothetical protein DPMN_097210 [Dreissena polymorpha]|uniref:Uncharacterized protein n=1 Tax=Dreissena polymorpha TaxID=45954 RepID=A0A9D4LBB3_DREPO|nr:hypothetical protein DPMN_097210 [Dreissena polymorpha]